MENAIQELCENFISRIESKIEIKKIKKNLSGPDLILFSLLHSGFNLLEIAVKLNISYILLRKRKSRLINRLNKALSV